jgi:iron complex outermembrane receptor protein
MAFFLFFLPALGMAQNVQVSGIVRDNASGETLIGANVLFAEGKGTVTDINGQFSMSVPAGDYNLQISYVGYQTIQKDISASGKSLFLEFFMESLVIDEVIVTADVARSRKTPVAFSNVLPGKIAEELSNQDIPMILNSTPGVYATQLGGGDGDARVSIRGFNQRNVAVMIDGVPVNDMENGWVYWSNWFGLDAVTRTIQVQRGLGASKLALPAVGGTINILSKGIENDFSGNIEQSFGSDGFMRTTFGLNSGKLKNDWSFTLAGSYKQGDGFAQQTWTKGFFYFLRADRKIGKHLLGFSVLGAPQSHGQRSYSVATADYDKQYAAGLFEGSSGLYSLMVDRNQGRIDNEEFFTQLGGFGLDSASVQSYYTNFIDTTGALGNGIRYNQHWGMLQRFDIQGTDTVYGPNEPYTERVNIYHKPQFTLRHFWEINPRMTLSNVAYLSIGKGGGARLKTTSGLMDEQGYVNFQYLYTTNKTSPWLSTPDGQRVNNFMRILINEHFWYGLLSTFSYQYSPTWSFSGGIDLRSYTGRHWEEIYDLMGGDYTRSFTDANREPGVHLKEGDLDTYHDDGLVNWGGLFFQTEYSTDKLSAFINLTGAFSGYNRIDYFMKKTLQVGDTVLNIGYSDTISYLGNTYDRNSTGLEFNSTGWRWFPGYTIKGGVNYNLTSNMNAFVNLGYLDKAPRFTNVFYYENVQFTDPQNEKVLAAELGYSLHYPRFAANLNGYYTRWQNKPFDQTPLIIGDDGEEYRANINGMNALHRGIELDFIFKILHNLELEGLFSLGNWTWDTQDSLRIYDDNQKFLFARYFDTRGVHVGDAAQTQIGGSLRYEPVKGLYLKGNFIWFGRYYAEFDPVTLDPNNYPGSFDENGKPRDSWQIPDYFLADLHMGYTRKLGKYRAGLRLNVLNLLSAKYISDAQNNDQYIGQITNSFDARSASTFMGMTRRYTFSLEFSF